MVFYFFTGSPGDKPNTEYEGYKEQSKQGGIKLNKTVRNEIKKGMACFVAAVMLTGLLPLRGFAADYSDTAGHWAAQAITRWSDYGILRGDSGLYEDNHRPFRLDAPLSRAELAAVMSRVLSLTAAAENTFQDLRAGAWYAPDMLKCSKAGLMLGSEGAIRPNDPATREETAVMLCRALGIAESSDKKVFRDSAQISDWAAGSVNALSSAGVMIGDTGGAFLPQKYMSRAELAVLLDRAIASYVDKAGTYEEHTDGAVVIAGPQVVLKGSTVTGSVVVGGAAANAPLTLTDTDVPSTLISYAPDAAVTVQGDSSVGQVRITAAASGTMLAVEQGARVGVVTADTDLRFGGEGEISAFRMNGHQRVAAAAQFVGQPTVTEWDVDKNGITMTVSLGGYHIADGVDLAAYKDQIIDSLRFSGLKFDKAAQTFHTVPFDQFLTGVLNQYRGVGFFPYLDPANGVTVYDRFVGLDPAGANSEAREITEALKEEYPGVRKGIQDTLKKEGTVECNAEGDLVISCGAVGYLKNFTNAVPVCGGGIPIAVCDLLMGVTIPAEAVREGVAVTTKPDSYYTIQEMKLHTEVWEYVSASHAGEEGVFAFDSNIEGNDQNASSSGYGKTYYVRRVAGDRLTKNDIRMGGTGGPNGTGKKLIKLVIDTRVGPTQWASSKNMSTFYSNLFRTSRDATGYSGNSSDTYTPADDKQWLKVENAILAGGSRPDDYNIGTNKYVVNYSGDHRGDVNDPAPMWMFIELPRVPKFSIESDMTVYVNLIGGMVGGSGQSTAVNGQPAAGQDGRYAFVISAGG